MAAVTLMRTAAETALAETLRGARGRRLPGDAAARARGAFARFAERGPAAPPRRGLASTPTCAPLMREAAPLAIGRAPREAQAASATASRLRRTARRPRSSIVERPFRPRASDARPRCQPASRWSALAEALGRGRSAARASLAGAGGGDNPACTSSTRAFMTDGAVIRVAAGSRAPTVHLRFRSSRRRRAVATATRIARRRRGGRVG